MSKKKTEQKPKTVTKAQLEGETLKRFVIDGVLHYFLYDWKPKRRLHQYVFAVVNTNDKVMAYTITLSASKLLKWLKDLGLGMHDAQQIKYEITGRFGK